MLYVVAFMDYCEIAFALIVPAIKTKGFIGIGMEQAVPLPTDNFQSRKKQVTASTKASLPQSAVYDSSHHASYVSCDTGWLCGDRIATEFVL